MFALKLTAGVIANLAIFGIPLFLLAGTWDWWRAWVLLGAVFIGSVGSVVTLPRSLLEERMKPPVQEGQPFAGLIVLIPLDVFRFHTFNRPDERVSSLGLVLFVVGYWIAYLSLRENAFAAPVVKHQTEREQVVIDTGVYRFVRHPMYAGGALLMIGMPLWLESYAGTLFAILPVGALVVRIVFEERFLKRELKGYEDYTAKVRYRLAPFLW